MGNRHSEISSCIRLYPCDTEPLYPGRPVGPNIRGLPVSILHPSSVHPGPWPSGLNYHGFSCRYEWAGLHGDTRAGETCSGQANSLLFLSSALFIIVATAVYASYRWSQTPHPQVQVFFSWSFYLGWASSVFFLCAGNYSACFPSGRP